MQQISGTCSTIWRKVSSIALLVPFLLSLWNTEAGAAAQNSVATAGKEPGVITLAYFPMAVPVAVLGETLKRDRILQKALKRDGITIRFKAFAKGSDVLPLIRAGQVDAVMFGDIPAIDAVTTGDMLIVGTVKRSFASVVAQKGTRVEQLRNRKVGNAYGSTAHYALLQALSSAGLTENEVTLVPLEVDQMVDALAGGSIYAFAAWEPTPTAALNRYPDRFDHIYRHLSNSYFLVAGRLAAEKPVTADALAAALARSIRWMKKRGNLDIASGWALAGMRDFSGKAPLLSVKDIAAITRHDLLDLPGTPVLSAAEIDKESPLSKQFHFLKAIGKLPAAASSEKFRSSIQIDLLPRLMKNPGRYQLNTFDYAP